eukprot:1354238-Amorphochlora_amoeboformis.AAC.1
MSHGPPSIREKLGSYKNILKNTRYYRVIPSQPVTTGGHYNLDLQRSPGSPAISSDLQRSPTQRSPSDLLAISSDLQ